LAQGEVLTQAALIHFLVLCEHLVVVALTLLAVQAVAVVVVELQHPQAVHLIKQVTMAELVKVLLAVLLSLEIMAHIQTQVVAVAAQVQ
jgi:hypothetical protein